MTYQQVYKAHRARVIRESILKAAIFGILAGLGVAAVIAFATIFVTFNGLWTAIGAGLGVAAIVTVVLYFALFRPTEKSVAESMDRMGFDERAITMLELQGEGSVMAEMQRTDAVKTFTVAAEKHGGKIPAKSVPASQKLRELGLNTKMLIIAGVIVVVAVISLVLTALPTERVKEMFLGTNSYGVTYNAGEHGNLYGVGGSTPSKKVSSQVDENKYSGRIVVSADDDEEDAYMFVGWDDDYYDEFNGASRSDKVNEGINATAKYEKIYTPEDDPEDGMNSADGDNPGGGNGDAPPAPGQQENSQQGNGNSNDPFGGEDAGGSDTPMNGDVIDGETDYKENFQRWYDEAMERLAQGKDIPESLRKLISAYFEALK